MKVSLDGGITYQDAPNDVYIIYDDLFIPGEDEKGVLEIHATHEGLIMDVWCGADNPGTSSEMADEIVERLVEENS